ncbi:MAG TPA: hypothetical protein VLL48_13110, partial [Longimicrobiales bacterium]|nr:hypothetical protein [Longimicrobiales bacterium]
ERAAVVLEGVEGPASALERGYLALGGADVDGARRELARALPGMEPARATEVVQLLASLDALGPDAREALGRALALERRGRVDEALSSVEEGLAEGTTTDRPVLLASAARLADRGGRHARAAAFRERLVQNHPASSQAPEALLDLARYHASSGGGAERAIELLERLIVQSPESPVVPAARRELERLRSRPSFSSRRRGT